MIAVVALAACVSAWGVCAWRRRLADDRGQFYTHEDMVRYQAFLKSVALGAAQEAEQKSSAGGNGRQRWTEAASAWRAKASDHARLEAEYRWRADLKQRIRGAAW
jgi:hypothetical protein